MKGRYRAIFSWLIVCAVLWGIISEHCSAQTAGTPTVAIMNFENNSVVDREKLDPLKKGLTDMLITELLKINGVKVVERRKVQSVVDELNLSDAELGDKNTSQKLGRLLGAQMLLFGGFSNLFGDKLRVDTRLVSAETGITLKTEQESAPFDQFFSLLNLLVSDIVKDLDVKLKPVDEARLKSVQGGKFTVYVTYCEGVSMEDSARALLKSGNQSEALAMYETARITYQRAFIESNGYLPAKQKAEEMGQIIARLKKGL